MASSRREGGKSTPITNFQPLVTGPRAKNPHPGAPDQKAKRRSPQEMKEIREKEALEKETTKEQQKNRIKKVAQIEDDLRREDNEQHTSNRSTMAPFQPHVYAPAKATELVEPQAIETMAIDKHIAREPYNDSGSEGSQDEYRPPACEVSEGESGESEAMAEEDEEDGAPNKNKVSWNGKNKPNRQDVKAARSTDTTDSAGKSETAVLNSKRKSSNAKKPEKPAKKAKNKQAVSGLIPGWDSTYNALSNACNEMVGPIDDDSMVQYGGMVGDEEEDDIERIAITSGAQKLNKKGTLPAMIKISATTSVTVPVTKKALRGGANKWNLNHLPGPEQQVVQKTFTQALVLLAKAIAGTMVPWSELSVAHVQSLVDKAFGENLHVVWRDDVWCGLVSYRLNSWRNGFGTAAATAVKLYIQDNEENFENDVMPLEQNIAQYIELFTTTSGDPPTAPFHWREYELDEETGIPKKRGRFQNPLIMYTLAHGHFADFDNVPDPTTLEKSELPSGALILALQAVYHAFCSWRTGKYIKDASPKGFFSADIYGDGIRRQWENEGCPRQHCFAIPPHHQGSHNGSLGQDLQQCSRNLRAGKEEETKQVNFITGKLRCL
ncbi:hypothetical protein BYT27DRAFT_7245062 [Phlegmacium glaucopus]|nr:hypothetical protein BYT27DRAFT_7245062 [Phlegmacium glaucopus]